MFTTYKSATTGRRGCTVMRSDKPDGQFVEISDGHVTPKAWDAIDGSLYIDKSGQPWMVFVHEWTSTDDGIGRMAAAKLSDDLTKLISEPIELFRADDASWARNHVTDGCWMYRCENGELLMLWSSTSSSGYSVGIARSDNGEIDGNWTHDTELLYSKDIAGDFDGGHGMVFADKNGKLWLALHSPNDSSSGRSETPIFVPIREENGTLVWDLTKYKLKIDGDCRPENELKSEYSAGETVTLKLATVTEHYYVLSVNGVEQRAESSDLGYTYYTFTMPYEDVTVKIEDKWVDIPEA